MKIGDGHTILFIGDSITDCGRARPVGMGGGLGSGYVSLVDSLMAAWYPPKRVRVLNTGVGGNRICELESRWRSDVLDLSPDWLVVMIGINDVWRQFDNPLAPGQVTLESYGEIYHRLLAQSRTELELDGLVVMSPYFLEPGSNDPMRSMMDDYGRAAKRAAAEADAVFVDVQAAFDGYMAHRPTQSLCGDRVHPNLTGHMLIARAFLTAVGFNWSVESGAVAGE